MHDEFRGTLARQGITEEAYLKAIEKTEADMHAEFRPGAEKRVKTLLVLSKVADAEGVEVADADVDAEVARGRERYPDDAQARSSTSARSAVAPTSGARSAGAGSSKASSTSGSPPTPIIRPCRTSRTRRASAVEGEQADGQRRRRRDGPRLHP